MLRGTPQFPLPGAGIWLLRSRVLPRVCGEVLPTEIRLFPPILGLLQPGEGQGSALGIPQCLVTPLSLPPVSHSPARETEARAGSGPRSPHGMRKTQKKMRKHTPKRGNVGLLLKKNKHFNSPRGPSKARVNHGKPLQSRERGDGIILEPQTPSPHPQPHRRGNWSSSGNSSSPRIPSGLI